MEIYLAPLQGLTDWIFRESYHKHIGSFDKCFSPFVRVQNSDFVRHSQCRDILPDHNLLQKPVPQFLGNDAASFGVFEELCLKHGYGEVNINMGCPFPKVANRSLGAGLLGEPENVEKLLHDIFNQTKLRISVKCRLGYEESSEFEQLIPIFNQFPLTQLILHARTGRQQYKGDVDMEAFARYAPLLNMPVCYNGDICSADDVARLLSVAPFVQRIMVGRGILQNPFLLSILRGESLSESEMSTRLKAFHHSVLDLCAEKYSGDLSILKRVTEMWEYQAAGVENGRKIYKKVKKCRSVEGYKVVISESMIVV
jgi:tRNA-dihydrouridine synthase